MVRAERHANLALGALRGGAVKLSGAVSGARSMWVGVRLRAVLHQRDGGHVHGPGEVLDIRESNDGGSRPDV